MAAYSFDGAFGNLNSSLANLGKQMQAGREREALGVIGDGLTSGTLDYRQAAGALARLGRVDAALDFVKLGEQQQQRRAGEDATRNLMETISGAYGNAAPAAPGSLAALGAGTGSALSPALNASESGGNWQAQNNEVGAGGQRGHFGRAQFGQARLQEAAAAGAIPQGTTPEQFMRSPELQKAAENWHFGDIDQFITSNGLTRAIGASINGIPVTAEGMRFVAHLGGKEGLAKFITSGGRYNPADANGTSLMDYLRLGARGATRMADAPAPGARNVEAASGQSGFFIPPGGQDAGMAPVDPNGFVTGPAPQPMSPAAFSQAAAAAEAEPMPPVFRSEGIGQPWMGTALSGGAQGQALANLGRGLPQRAMQGEVLPPSRPYDLNADRFAAGGAPTLAQMPPQRLPAPVEIDPNSNDGGSRSFAYSQGRNAPVAGADGFVVPPAPTSDAERFTRANGGAQPAPLALPGSTQAADYTGSGAVAPVASKDLPRPTTREQFLDYGETKRMEANQRNIGKLVTALASPNLPANARAIGELFLKDALDRSKTPDSVKEFLYAKAMGWTTAPNPGAYAKEKQSTDTPAIRDFEYAKKNGYAGTILEFERDRAANKARQGMTASDQKALFAAEDELPNLDNTLATLSRARELNRDTYTGKAAGVQAWLGTNLKDGFVPNIIAEPQKAERTREFGQIMSMEAIKSMSALLKGATTEREMAEFQRILGDPSTPPDIRERTIDRMITLATRQRDISRGRINDLRGKSGLDPLSWDEQGRPSAGASSGQRPGAARQPAQAQPVAAPPSAIEFLRANPGARDQFDAKYGRGAAASVLGR